MKFPLRIMLAPGLLFALVTAGYVAETPSALGQLRKASPAAEMPIVPATGEATSPQASGPQFLQTTLAFSVSAGMRGHVVSMIKAFCVANGLGCQLSEKKSFWKSEYQLTVTYQAQQMKALQVLRLYLLSSAVQ